MRAVVSDPRTFRGRPRALEVRQAHPLLPPLKTIEKNFCGQLERPLRPLRVQGMTTLTRRHASPPQSVLEVRVQLGRPTTLLISGALETLLGGGSACAAELLGAGNTTSLLGDDERGPDSEAGRDGEYEANDLVPLT